MFKQVLIGYRIFVDKVMLSKSTKREKEKEANQLYSLHLFSCNPKKDRQ